MNNHDPGNGERPVIRGFSEISKYKAIPDLLGEYRGNPFIEALPEIWDWSGDEPKVMDELTHYFKIDKQVREAPLPIRQHKLGTFKHQFFQVSNRVRDLEISVSIILRQGYIARNPMNARYRRDLHDRLIRVNMERRQIVSVGNLGFTLLGAPGQGKTRSLERILLLYPQIIYHENYPGDPGFRHTQVVWLYLTCSHDKSTRGLCLMFFKEVDQVLGTEYYDEYEGENENALIAGMAHVAATIGLGLLVVDEIEFLISAGSGGKDGLLKFLVQFENTLRIAVVLVGTCKAAKLMASNPHLARRSVGTGGSLWLPLRRDDPEWNIFLEAMWEHQYLNKYTILTSELADVFYEESMGILNYLVDLFFYAQLDAMNNGSEILNVLLIRNAAQNRQIFNRPYVDALRYRKKRHDHLLEDIFPPNFESFDECFKNEINAPTHSTAIDVSDPPNQPTRASRSTSGGNGGISSLQPPPPPQPTTAQTPLARKRKTIGKNNFPAGSIMAICAEALATSGESPYGSLKKAGLVVNVLEFLERKEVQAELNSVAA